MLPVVIQLLFHWRLNELIVNQLETKIYISSDIFKGQYKFSKKKKKKILHFSELFNVLIFNIELREEQNIY